MRNIIFTANTSWYLWNFRKNTIKAFIDRGDKIICVCPADSTTSKLKQLGANHVELKLGQYETNIISECRVLKNISSILKNIRPDFVFTFTTKNNLYFSLCSILHKHLLITNISGLGQYFSAGGLKKTLVTLAYRIAIKQSDFVFFQNNEDMAFFEKRKMVKKGQYSRIYGSGVNLNEYYFPNLNSRFKEETIHFTLVARLLKEKGVSEFIEAAKVVKKAHPNTNFHIYGPLSNKKNYEISSEYIAEHHNIGHVIYHGESSNISEELNDKHCMVLPTYYNEGVPKTLIEGLAKGLAIITTKNGGCTDTVLHNKNGYLVRKRDSNQLIGALMKYIALTTLEKKQFSIESRSLAEELFDEQTNIQEYLKFM